MNILHGDCLSVLPTLDADSIDSCVTDPPYELGFMGKKWDASGIAFRSDVWREVYRVLKPGGYLMAFGGTRGFHRMFCAIEDAGFEIRDCIMWMYGSGFPKSHNLDGDRKGWGTALKPAYEPICVARKPLTGTVAENVLRYGTGAINVDGCRVEGDERPLIQSNRRLENNTYGAGLGGSVNMGATTLGRWPANVIHDGSDEVVGAFPDAKGQQGDVRGSEPSRPLSKNTFGMTINREPFSARNDSGSAARFFYTAKADKGDRLGSKHPTVKPVDLMAYLCRLVTQPGGTVLDPFAGSGSTGMACLREGFNAVLIEREAEYVADIKRRLAHVSGKDAPLFAEAL